MRRLIRVASLAIAGAVLAVCCARSAHTQGIACLVAMDLGSVQGLDRGASCAFLGVPFAAPPTGPLRWKRPHPVLAWAPAVLNATTAPATCAQLNSATGLPSGSEDCLKLNIWTPNPAPVSGAPVIVWLHPGSFVSASANFPPQNGQNLAALAGAVVVAPNYRLGPFGFLAQEALASEDSAAGNYGFLDQRAALVWVRAHIAAFGGDPGNVTLGGQSAGAHSVGLHLTSSASAGLFHRAIMESGYASLRWRTAAEARAQGDDFAVALGCTTGDASSRLACLRTKTRDEILKARPPALFEQFSETATAQWTPVVDGVEIPDQPRVLYEQGAFNRVPVLLGANRDEGWTFTTRGFPAGLTVDEYVQSIEREFGIDAPAIRSAYPAADFATPKDALVRLVGDVEYTCEARRVARALERAGMPVFLYSFEYEVDAVVLDRVVHGMEVNFVFGNNFGPPLFAPYALTPTDLSLSRDMTAYWTRFAANGTPNAHGQAEVEWPAFKHPTGNGRGADKYLALGAASEPRKRLAEDACDFWEPFFFRSVTGAVPASIQ